MRDLLYYARLIAQSNLHGTVHLNSPQSHTNALKGCHGELECSLMQAGDSLMVVSVLWLYNALGSCLSSCLIYNKNKPLITTISLASLQPG